ncbi:MAG: AbrB/MazE/SpoVT family DNA-binding domain-containing protein [Actinomycetota bacterium]|nr:AbrB/MazE/SpoVT family DNA-binding domain-containing protein [Actinomycetota bacterium]
MEARARVTSKGQVTVPVEVRRALGVEEGDTLVFELASGYATVRKRRPTLQVAEEVRARYLGGGELRPITNREAIEEYFASEHEPRAGDILHVSSGDGTFEERIASESERNDADR